jgi:hypothetical protein
MRQMILRFLAAGSLAAGISLSLAAPAAALPQGAQGPPIKLLYSFTYDPPANSTTYPAVSTLGGTLQFFYRSIPQFGQFGPTTACGGSISIGPVGAASSSGGSFIPVDPCFGNPTTELLFSFGGPVLAVGPPIIPQAYAFPANVLINGPPILPILLGSFASGNSFVGTGPIYGFASPETLIGSWTISATQVPEPPTLPLVALGVGFVLLRRLQRRSRS